jgi:hypothetical protein
MLTMISIHPQLNDQYPILRAQTIHYIPYSIASCFFPIKWLGATDNAEKWHKDYIYIYIYIMAW